jgi:hypothetical protein
LQWINRIVLLLLLVNSVFGQTPPKFYSALPTSAQLKWHETHCVELFIGTGDFGGISLMPCGGNLPVKKLLPGIKPAWILPG